MPIVMVVVVAAATLLLANSEGGDGLRRLGLSVGAILIYFLPSLLAWGKENWVAIFALNFLAGWTCVGWVGAFVWALNANAMGNGGRRDV